MHIGRNISKVRELLNIKQEQLAICLKVSQQTISKIEQTPKLSEQIVERIAKALEISPKMIMEFDENLLVRFFGNSEDQGQYVDRLSPVMLFEKIIELYERLLINERRIKS